MTVYIRLLGQPAIRHDGQWLEPTAGLPSALLYYLAYKDAWVNREDAAFLFWSDVPEANARRNLRNLILRVKNLDYAVNLETERNRIRWQVETDISAYKKAVDNHDYKKVPALYKGDLLAGFHLENALEFTDWLELEREVLRQTYQKAVSIYAQDLVSQERYAEAAEVLESLRKVDPFDEGILRRQLQTLQMSQQHRQAITSFEQFKGLLEKEFGAEPEQATFDLVATIQQDQSAAPKTAPKKIGSPLVATQPAPTPNVRHNLPAQATPFVGRELERKRITEHLADPACRLLTLIAPGGMGKTSLALAVAKEQIERFEDGVWFVPFASVTEPEQMLYALTDALTLFPPQDPKAQLFEYLSDKNLLLILDNLEHLTQGFGLLSELLEAAPSAKLLATSREQLHLRAEWLFDLTGLSFPTADEEESAETFDAVELFLQSGERIRAGFGAEPGNLHYLAKICRRVEGMPLAIELAASWLRVLSLEEIAAELETGFDLLESSARDIPERQQSIRAVFEYSWQLLSPAQQRTLAALSVFRGHFDREAAQRIVGVSTRGLLELVSKSLLRRRTTGRFDLHPLVQQYAHERLTELKPLEQETLTKHGEFYLEHLHKLDKLRKGGHEKEALDAMSEDSANIEATWQWAVETLKLDELCEMSGLLEKYFIQRSRFQEGIGVYQKALDQLDETQKSHHAAIGRLLTSQGWLYTRMGQFEQAGHNAEGAEALLQPLEPSANLTEMLNLRGAIYGITGYYAKAKTYFEKAISVAKDLGEQRYTAYYLNNLAISEKELGNYERAEQLYREALKLGKQLGEYVSCVRNLNNLALLLTNVEKLEEAKTCLEEGLALAESMGFEQTQPHLLSSLGNVMVRFGDYGEAQHLFEKALQLVRKNHIKSHEAVLLGNLGMVAVGLDNKQARQFLREGLELAYGMKNSKTCLGILTEIAQLYVKEANLTEAATILALVLNHEATDSATKDRAKRLLEEYQDVFSSVHLSVAENPADMPDLFSTVSEVLPRL